MLQFLMVLIFVILGFGMCIDQIKRYFESKWGFHICMASFWFGYIIYHLLSAIALFFRIDSISLFHN